MNAAMMAGRSKGQGKGRGERWEGNPTPISPTPTPVAISLKIFGVDHLLSESIEEDLRIEDTAE